MSEPSATPLAGSDPIRPEDIQQAAQELLAQSIRLAARADQGGPIRIDVEDAKNHPDEYVEFIRAGWRFKDLRLYEEALSTSQLAEVVCRRISDWKLTIDGKPVPFAPRVLRESLEALPAESKDRRRAQGRIDASYRTAMDELSPDVAGFIWAAYRTAYSVAGALGPNG